MCDMLMRKSVAAAAGQRRGVRTALRSPFSSSSSCTGVTSLGRSSCGPITCDHNARFIVSAARFYAKSAAASHSLRDSCTHSTRSSPFQHGTRRRVRHMPAEYAEDCIRLPTWPSELCNCAMMLTDATAPLAPASAGAAAALRFFSARALDDISPKKTTTCTDAAER